MRRIVGEFPDRERWTISVEPLNDEELKALAHPLRVRMLDALINHGPSTATKLAQRFGENTGATSYHLRQLARHGFIEEDSGRGSERERWWRAARKDWSIRTFAWGDGSEIQRDARVLVHELTNGRLERLRGWFDGLTEWGDEWRAASTGVDARCNLTLEELDSLSREIEEVITRHVDLSRARGRVPPGAVMVNVQAYAFPASQLGDDGQPAS